MIGIIVLLAMGAGVITIAAATERVKLWPAVFILCVIELLKELPL